MLVKNFITIIVCCCYQRLVN